MKRGDLVPLRAFVLIVVAPLVILVGTLVLGFASAPEAPDTGGAAPDAVLRVIAPEGQYYRILWDYRVAEVGTLEPGAAYKDYAVPPEAGSPEEGFNLALERLVNETGEEWDSPLRAILFVEGEYATCSASGIPVVRLYWRPGWGAFHELLMKATCGRYQYA